MFKRSCILSLIIFQILFFGAVLAKPPVYMQVKVYYDTPEELTQLRSIQLDIIQTKENYIEIVTFRSGLDEIILDGFEIEVIHEDLTKFYQSRLDSTRDMGGYKTLSELSAHTDQVVLDHPDIASRVDIGLTLEGRTMWAIKISDNPEVDEDEPEVLITGAIHAREVITPEICVATIDLLTDGYGTDLRMTYLVDNREIWFIPVINVDGYYYNEVIAPEGGGMWRKNRRDNGDGSWGVDLNRNFGYMWGYDNNGSSYLPSSELYRGTGPFSEPTTQNIRDFTSAHNFELAIHFHASGSWFGPAWFYNYTTTPDENKFARMASVMTSFSGYEYTHGLMNGCHEDWDYGEQTLKNKILSLIIEVGVTIDGFWPPLDRIPLHLDNNVPMCTFLASVAGRLDDNFEASPGQATLNVEDTMEYDKCHVSWTLTEAPDNPAIGCEITEYSISEGVIDPGENLASYSSDIFTINSDHFYSAPSSYFSGHINNQVSYLQTLEPHNVKSGDAIEFRTYYGIQPNYDYAYVEISTDGENFSPIEGNITTNYNPYGKNRGNGITGSSGDWIEGIFDLSGFVDQEIYIKFSYYADQSISDEGFYIDDISPIHLISENIISNVQPTGEYTFTDHEPGRHFYKIRCTDIDGQWGSISEIEYAYVRPPFICGDVNGDEDITILDVVYLINYKYKEGPAPEFLESADVNNDGNITILDAVYLINYKYKSGPDPACP